jgi:uncharacterized coiled-coil protein SlyX
MDSVSYADKDVCDQIAAIRESLAEQTDRIERLERRLEEVVHSLGNSIERIRDDLARETWRYRPSSFGRTS